MCECETQYAEILVEIEELKKQNDETGIRAMVSMLAGKMDQVTSVVENLTTAVGEVKTTADETHKELFGNGDIENSQKFELIVLKRVVEQLVLRLDKKEEAEKEEKEKNEEIRRSYTRPIILDIVKFIMFGGGTGGVFWALLKIFQSSAP